MWILLLLQAVRHGQGFVVTHHHHHERTVAVRATTAATAGVTFAAAQAETLAKIRAAIPLLAEKDGWSGEVEGKRGKLEAFDAPGTPNVAWLSSLTVDEALCSLTVFNGPLTDVPHLASRVVLEDSAMSLFLDWRPRAYGAYEMVRPDGTYPGPEELGRDAFAYSGARKSMESKFYTPEHRELVDSILKSFEGATKLSVASDLDLLTRGPCCVDVEMPLTDLNVAAVIVARAKAADAWLAWHLDPQHAHKPGAPVNTQYVFDTKAKQNMYGVLLDVLKARFGDDGVQLTALDSGPLDEAYVGGGS
ncbi:hypothetical protein CTAYLR_001641 [Chrysophaeum taylorii]|uniref:Uncharacterized protein n=1 Tax=Chrysophaeum taylorii TaxID=2483200 RepID=A0AAD7XKY2_9STRA|nr:hypothetical protein CTAYLR_001641 [Chrysophaeum taylorii]